jgi:quinol monooxygenase YgiN
MTGAVYLFAYVEAAPAGEDDAADCLVEFSTLAQEAEGCQYAAALQSINRAGEFSLAQAWEDMDSLDGFWASGPAKSLLHEMDGALVAPMDIRRHFALYEAEPVLDDTDAIHVITHVDVVPVNEDAGHRHVEGYASKMTGKTGCLAAGGYAQIGKSNHMTIWEAWQDEERRAAHLSLAHVISFRADILPLSGSPYDARLFRVI